MLGYGSFARECPRSNVRTVRAGNAFLSQSSKWVHFGLSNITNIERVVVHWPGGKPETFADLAADQRYRLVQGSGTAVPISPKAIAARATRRELAASIPRLPPDTEHARVPLGARVPLPELPYKTFAGEGVEFAWGEPTLIQLWASWCPMCRAEMAEFTARADELRNTKLRIVALSVDGLGADTSDATTARKEIENRNFPFTAARATAALLTQLELLRAELFSNSRPFPVPTSFLVDADGRLSTIYIGPLKVDQLLADLQELDSSEERQRELSIPLSGRWLGDPTAVRFSYIAKAFREAGFAGGAEFYQQQAAPQMAISHCGLAIEAEQRGDLGLARDHYQQALKLAPRSAIVQNYVGEHFLRQRNPAAALRRLQAAIALDANVADFHFNLATAHLLQNRPQAARASFETALQIDPRSAKSHTALAKLMQDAQQWKEAMSHLQMALSIDPQLAPVHVYLGVAYIQQRQLPKAAEHFAEALRLAPDSIEARAHLANVLAEQGKTAEAVGHYREILKNKPDSYGIALKLAWCLATCGDENVRDSADAIRLAERVAAGTKRQSPMVLDVLAAAYASAGRFETALKTIDEATELADANPAFRQLLDKRRELYDRKRSIRLQKASE